MELILNMYDHGEVIADLLSFNCIDFNDFFSVLSHNQVTNG